MNTRRTPDWGYAVVGKLLVDGSGALSIDGGYRCLEISPEYWVKSKINQINNFF